VQKSTVLVVTEPSTLPHWGAPRPWQRVGALKKRHGNSLPLVSGKLAHKIYWVQLIENACPNLIAVAIFCMQ